jgi:hypothetical protein
MGVRGPDSISMVSVVTSAFGFRVEFGRMAEQRLFYSSRTVLFPRPRSLVMVFPKRWDPRCVGIVSVVAKCGCC